MNPTHDQNRVLLISNSTLYGSGYLDHAAGEIVDFLRGISRILFIPYALHDRDAYAALAGERFRAMSIQLTSIHNAPDEQDAVNDADAIFIGGGNTFRLLKNLYDVDLLHSIHRRVFSGMPYIGSSAGANVAGPTIMTTNDMPIVRPVSFDALGLVPFQICPHYQDRNPRSTHMGETQEERLFQFHEENETPVVALREGGIIRREGGVTMLRGSKGARIFRRGEAPVEKNPGDVIDGLI